MMQMHYIVIKSGVVGLITLIGIILDEKTGIPIAAAVSIAAAWGGGLWYLGRKLQALEDGQALNRLQTEQIKEGQLINRAKVTALESRIDNLDCQRCPKPKS